MTNSPFETIGKMHDKIADQDARIAELQQVKDRAIACNVERAMRIEALEALLRGLKPSLAHYGDHAAVKAIDAALGNTDPANLPKAECPGEEVK